MTAVNDAPVVAVAIADQSNARGVVWSYQVPAGTFSDVDGDTLTYSASLGDGSALPDWLTFTAATRTFSGNPPLNFNGNLSLTVTASDGTLIASDTFVLTVTANNTAPLVGIAIADVSVLANAAWSYQVPAGTFSDADGDTLTYSATLGGGLPLPEWLSFDPTTFTFSGTPPFDSAGDISLIVTASDGSLSVTDTFVLTVTVNVDAPVVLNPLSSQTSDEDTVWSYQINELTFSDPNDDPLTYSATLGNGARLPDWLTFTADTRTFAGTPPPNFVGEISLKVTATDGNFSVSDMFVLFVMAVNDAPAVAIPIVDQSSAEDTLWSYQVPANAFSDIDSAELTYSATLGGGAALPSWLRFDAVTRTFSGTPLPADFNGTLNLTVTASDGDLLTASDTFVLTVTPVNDAPVVANIIADQSSARGAVWSYQVPAGTFSDVDGNALTYSAALGDGSALPAWLTFTAATQTFSGTPPADSPSSLNLKVTASDGALSVADTFVLIVGAAPSIIVANGGSYVATAGVDIFVIDSSQTINATIVGFDFGDVLRYVNNVERPVFDFPYSEIDDGIAGINTERSRITLTNLAFDFFVNEQEFNATYGEGSIDVPGFPVPLAVFPDPNAITVL